jgi:hypothetical protein
MLLVVCWAFVVASLRDREILRPLHLPEEGRVYEWVSTLSSRVRYPMVFQHSVETANIV